MIETLLKTFPYALGGNCVEVAAGEDAIDDGSILALGFRGESWRFAQVSQMHKTSKEGCAHIPAAMVAC